MEDQRTAWFETLYAATFRHILGYAVRRCDCPEDAADVVAETFAIAWRRRDVVPPGDQARLWLYGVARNVLANHRRGVTRRQGLSAALAAQASLAARESLGAEVAGLYQRGPDDSAGSGVVGRIFRSLSDDDRELLSLVAWEGLDHGEIAEVLGCSRNAVRIRLHRARRRMARELASAGVTAGPLTMSRRAS